MYILSFIFIYKKKFLSLNNIFSLSTKNIYKDRKIMGRYTMETNPEIKEKEKEDDSKKKKRIWIIVVILISISIILGFYLNKLFTKLRRKKRLNEVIDDYDYTPVNK